MTAQKPKRAAYRRYDGDLEALVLTELRRELGADASEDRLGPIVGKVLAKLGIVHVEGGWQVPEARPELLSFPFDPSR
jgi:hypothetical protein